MRFYVAAIKQPAEALHANPKHRVAWRVSTLHLRNKAISCLPGIGNFSRAIYRLGIELP